MKETILLCTAYIIASNSIIYFWCYICRALHCLIARLMKSFPNLYTSPTL